MQLHGVPRLPCTMCLMVRCLLGCFAAQVCLDSLQVSLLHSVVLKRSSTHPNSRHCACETQVCQGEAMLEPAGGGSPADSTAASAWQKLARALQQVGRSLPSRKNAVQAWVRCGRQPLLVQLQQRLPACTRRRRCLTWPGSSRRPLPQTAPCFTSGKPRIAFSVLITQHVVSLACKAGLPQHRLWPSLRGSVETNWGYSCAAKRTTCPDSCLAAERWTWQQPWCVQAARRRGRRCPWLPRRWPTHRLPAVRRPA